jgi:hypothetical protein
MTSCVVRDVIMDDLVALNPDDKFFIQIQNYDLSVTGNILNTSEFLLAYKNQVLDQACTTYDQRAKYVPRIVYF